MTGTVADKTLAIEVFEGGLGDLVLFQEWPAFGGESYMRVVAKMEDAEKLCAQIMAVAARARRK